MQPKQRRARAKAPERMRRFLCGLALFGAMREAAAATAPPEEPPAEEGAPAVVEDESTRASAWARRAAEVDALLEGTLDPAIDARTLTVLDPAEEDGLLRAEDWRHLAARVTALRTGRGAEPSSAPREATEPGDDAKAGGDEGSPSEAGSEARAALLDAYARFLALTPEERRARLEAHAQRRRAYEARQQARKDELDRLARERAQLEAFFAGTLDAEIDPSELLRIDLARLEADEVEAGGPEAALDTAMAAARAEVDALRLAFLGRSAAQRRALLRAHRARQAEPVPERAVGAPDLAARAEASAEAAEDEAAAAARARQEALEQARRAESEARRAVAEERARLAGIQETLARRKADLARARAESETRRDAALGLRRRVDETIEAVARLRAPPSAADALHEEVRSRLAEERDRLRRALAAMEGPSEIPELGRAATPMVVRADADLEELHRNLATSIVELREQESALRWDRAEMHRNAIVLLNAARLHLLAHTSEAVRSAVTGFGPVGVRQVLRELDQIALELRFHAHALPRHLGRGLAALKTSPVPILLGLAKLLGALWVFAWWRRRAGRVLMAAHRRWREAPASWRSRMLATLTWYAARVHRPLEWLLLFGALYSSFPALEAFPEVRLLWIVALWVLLGSSVIFFVDAVAAREADRNPTRTDTSTLRIRSLRLVGLAIVYTGLVLSLANAFVGKGAIYAWVLGTCWFLAVPIALLLVAWWKPYIFARIRRDAATPFSRWVTRHQQGRGAAFVAGIAGFYLFGRGLWRWTIRRAATFDTTKHFLAYLFRREVARQAVARQEGEVLRPLDPAVRRALVEGGEGWIDAVNRRELEALLAALSRPQASITAVVGERGAGKTALLRRVEEARAEQQRGSEYIYLSCPSTGFAGLCEALARRIGAAGEADLASIARALRGRGPLVVAVDDAQRIVRPTIGGMAGLDALGELTRQAGDDVSWIVAIGSAAWQYVSRARGDRLFFTQTLRLSPWNEQSIARLVTARTRAAGLSPSFEGLVIPRQYDDTEISESERVESGYYRILWDYSDGNPRVAAHFWAESLRHDERAGVVRVRLFHEPAAAELDGLPLTLQFVLRAVIQLEQASRSEVAAAVWLPLADVDDALRFALARGYLEAREGFFGVTLGWYRAVTRMLQRQHLLHTR